jgi:starch-binding outer membrane protein, SusD/RagB family
MTNSRIRAVLRPLAWVAPMAATVFVAGCNLDVINPGPIQADFLDDTGAFAAVVNGAGRNLSEGINWVAYTGGAVAREIHPAGSTAAFGISVRQQAGKLTEDESGTWWDVSQRARWTAEEAVERGKRLIPAADAAKDVRLAQAMVWAGFANRLLGENFCDGVIDGGPLQPYTVYLERAEAYFTEAIPIATAVGTPAGATLATAATAGRASVRLLRNNLPGAATDAATVASAFVYRMSYFNSNLDQYNRIYWASANQPYRAHTVWNTFYENYRKTTPDPRVPFDSSLTVLLGDAAVGSLGRVRWYFQTKYPTQTSPINLASGWEMRLIEAEAKLVAGDVPGAMALINQHRIALSLAPWTATTAADAWTHLKRERGIELWLEGRRLGDFRRWAALARPGAQEDMTGRDLCFTTPLSEKETNPNF